MTHVVSVVDVLKETRRAFNGGRETAYRLPTTQAEVNDLAFVFENQSPEELGKLTTLDWSKSHISMRVKWQEATDYQPLLDFIDEQMRVHLTGKVEWVGTGPVYVVSRLVQVMLMDLAVSFGTAFGFVCCFMFLMLGSFRLGLIAILPNLFPIALVLGAMGVLGLPLDLNSLLIASIALGIAVDDTVHFLHHFKTSIAQQVSCQAASETCQLSRRPGDDHDIDCAHGRLRSALFCGERCCLSLWISDSTDDRCGPSHRPHRAASIVAAGLR